MAWNNSGWRDKTYDRETLDETFIALAGAFRALIYSTPMLIPATVDELVTALRIDYENHGLYDISTFACGVCQANGTTYRPWCEGALDWLREHSLDLRVCFVGRNESKLNLCYHCAKRISGLLWDLPGSRGAVAPPFDLCPDPPRPPLNRFSGLELDDQRDA